MNISFLLTLSIVLSYRNSNFYVKTIGLVYTVKVAIWNVDSFST